MADMLETVRLVKGDCFHAVTFAGVQARAAMSMYDRTTSGNALPAERLRIAKELMDCVRRLATGLALPPGQLAEALKHARVMYREGFER